MTTRTPGRHAAILALALVATGAEASGCPALGELVDRGCRRLVDTYQRGDDEIILSGYSYHVPGTWSSERRSELNAEAWGFGVGRTAEEPDGDTHTVFVLGFKDSHSQLQSQVGYAYNHFWGPRDGVQAGLGFTAAIVQRKDIWNGVPFPALLPLAALRIGNATLQATYIPTLSGTINHGSTLYVFGRVTLRQPARMNVLVIGGGGREHALAWKLAQSPRVARVYVAPGNGGTARASELTNVPLTDTAGLVDFARREAVGLTVVGPEAPLAAGVVDAFRAAGLRVFGPTRAAAQLESSKDYAKSFMRRHGIPTAASQTFTDAAQAHAYVAARGAPIVVKADGLAAGKGVVVATTLPEAHAAIDRMLVDNAMGAAGARVVVEDFLAGEEASFIVMVDGAHVLPLASSQDHKRLRDGDEGPNTGGMGAYSPAPVVTPQVHARIMREVIQPAVQGMAADGIPYTGFLYAGVMLDAKGAPRVLEFNCRLGDPETQPILVRLRSDLVDLLDHGIAGTLDRVEAEWDRRAALGVVLAAGGYPDAPRSGAPIEGLDRVTADAHPDVQVFHAGTTLEGDRVVVSGGRVLCVTALGDSVRQAQRAAYRAIAALHFDGMQYRTDIGHRAIARRGERAAST